jgi:DNA-binding NarL/FixJ family response regulator
MPLLGPLETKIAFKILEGLENKDIAADIGTSTQVVKNYTHTLKDKTGTETRVALALFFVRHPEWLGVESVL